MARMNSKYFASVITKLLAAKRKENIAIDENFKRALREKIMMQATAPAQKTTKQEKIAQVKEKSSHTPYDFWGRWKIWTALPVAFVVMLVVIQAVVPQDFLGSQDSENVRDQSMVAFVDERTQEEKTATSNLPEPVLLEMQSINSVNEPVMDGRANNTVENSLSTMQDDATTVVSSGGSDTQNIQEESRIAYSPGAQADSNSTVDNTMVMSGDASTEATLSPNLVDAMPTEDASTAESSSLLPEPVLLSLDATHDFTEDFSLEEGEMMADMAAPTAPLATQVPLPSGEMVLTTTLATPSYLVDLSSEQKAALKNQFLNDLITVDVAQVTIRQYEGDIIVVELLLKRGVTKRYYYRYERGVWTKVTL